MIRNQIQITARNVRGSVGKSTVLGICAEALWEKGYSVFPQFGDHSTFVGLEEPEPGVMEVRAIPPLPYPIELRLSHAGNHDHVGFWYEGKCLGYIQMDNVSIQLNRPDGAIDSLRFEE